MDPKVTMLQILTLALEYLINAPDQKPGDPASLHPLHDLNGLRQQLQVDLGMEPTDLRDPNGFLNHPRPPE